MKWALYQYGIPVKKAEKKIVGAINKQGNTFSIQDLKK
jgi:hypothetical protein